MLCTLLSATAGRARVDGYDITTQRDEVRASTERFIAVDTRCSSGRARWTVIHYDNCAPKATSACL